GSAPKPAPKTGAASRAPRPGTSRPVGPVLRKDLTIQRYAEIAAGLARGGADRAAGLRAHLLTEPAWALVHQHWTKAMAVETHHGGYALASAFDEAYVAAQERLRRPIDVAAYARLQVGVERGEVGQVLAELELELSDLVRLQSVWAKRLADSPEL